MIGVSCTVPARGYFLDHLKCISAEFLGVLSKGWDAKGVAAAEGSTARVRVQSRSTMPRRQIAIKEVLKPTETGNILRHSIL
jgi:hypothetical protein